MLSVWLITVCANLAYLLRWCLSGFSAVELLFLLPSAPLSSLYSLQGCRYAQFTLAGCLAPPPWAGNVYIKYLEFFCMGDLLPSIYSFTLYLFSNLFIAVWTPGYLFYMLGYIIQYCVTYFAQIILVFTFSKIASAFYSVPMPPIPFFYKKWHEELRLNKTTIFCRHT